MNNPKFDLNNPDWKKQREKDWLVFEQHISERLRFDEDRDAGRYMDVAYKYFMGEEVELPLRSEASMYRLMWTERIFLHPSPNVESIRSIIRDYIKKGYELPTFMYWGVPQSEFARFIESKVLSKDVVDHFMEALYGNSFDEALALRRVDFEEKGTQIVYDLSSEVNAWINHGCRGRFDVNPIDRVLVLFYGAIERAENRHINDKPFNIKKLFKTLRVFENRDSSHVEAAQKVVRNLRSTLKANRDTYCPALQEYIDSFEFEE